MKREGGVFSERDGILVPKGMPEKLSGKMNKKFQFNGKLY